MMETMHKNKRLEERACCAEFQKVGWKGIARTKTASRAGQDGAAMNTVGRKVEREIMREYARDSRLARAACAFG